MQTLYVLAVALVFLLVGSSLIWRVAARWRSLPCPRWLGFFLDNPLAAAEARKQIERAGLRPGMRVLDVGCGTGRLTLPIAEDILPGGQVLAVDMQDKMLATVQRRARERGLTNIETRKVRMGEGIFGEEDAFDRAFLTTVLGEIPNQRAAMQEIYAALKPGGMLSVAEIIFDPHFQSIPRVCRLAEEAGFRVGTRYGNRLDFTVHLEKPA